MQAKLHQDVLGARSGDTITVDATQAEFLVREGYASIEGDDTDKALMGGVSREADPTLAENREAPGELDVTGLEDDATNDEQTKIDEVQASGRPRSKPATAKRPEGQQKDDVQTDTTNTPASAATPSEG